MRAPNRQLHVAHFKQRDGISLDTRCYFTAASRTSVLQHDATSTKDDPKRGLTRCIRREWLSTALFTNVWSRRREAVATQQTWRARRRLNQGLVSSNFSAAAHTTPIMPTFLVTTRQLRTTDHTTQHTADDCAGRAGNQRAASRSDRNARPQTLLRICNRRHRNDRQGRKARSHRLPHRNPPRNHAVDYASLRFPPVAYAAPRGRFATVAITVGIAASDSKAEPMKITRGEPVSIM